MTESSQDFVESGHHNIERGNRELPVQGVSRNEEILVNNSSGHSVEDERD